MSKTDLIKYVDEYVDAVENEFSLDTYVDKKGNEISYMDEYKEAIYKKINAGEFSTMRDVWDFNENTPLSTYFKFWTDDVIN